jgi:hypothetical protein
MLFFSLAGDLRPFVIVTLRGLFVVVDPGLINGWPRADQGGGH